MGCACESGLVQGFGPGSVLFAVFSEIRALAFTPVFAFDPAPILPPRPVVIQMLAHILVIVV